MIALETARQMALSLPNTVEQDHFGIPSFRVSKRIFSTLWIHDNKMMVKLSLIDQAAFSVIDGEAIYPVPNKYAGMGCTLFDLTKVDAAILENALRTGYQTILDKKKKHI
jgi:hypothetical protein